MTSDPYEALLKAAGLVPDGFEVSTFVPEASDQDPALLMGRYGLHSACCLVVGHQLASRPGGDPRWSAVAHLSAFPANVMNQLTEVQRDRLRQASLDVNTPDGTKAASAVLEAPTEDSRAEAERTAPRAAPPSPPADITLPDSEVQEEEPEPIPDEVLDQLPEELRSQVS